MTSPSSQKQIRLAAREGLRAAKGSRLTLVGLDGFIDEIIHVVDQRYDFEKYSRLSSMAAYAARIDKSAGKSCNVEWVVRNVKLGGNGPIMAGALGELGNAVLYVGAVGWPEVDPVFDVLKKYGDVVTLAAPGHTDAVEFDDGKIMHGKIETMRLVTWARLLERLGGEATVRQRLAQLDLVALTNWTMLPFSNEIYESLFALAQKQAGKRPLFFFDIADPEKRTRDDLQGVIQLLGRAAGSGLHIILGLNHKEAQQVAAVLGIDGPMGDSADEVRRLAEAIQRKSALVEVVVHPRHRAAAAASEGAWCVEGPFTPRPAISTGAGDNFNAGYCHARLRGLAPELALVVGTATSGFYVRSARSPSPADMDQFLSQWAEDHVPEAVASKHA